MILYSIVNINSTVAELVPSNFRGNSFQSSLQHQTSELLRILVTLDLILVLDDLFYDRERVFDGIKVGRVRGKELAFVSM